MHYDILHIKEYMSCNQMFQVLSITLSKVFSVPDLMIASMFIEQRDD